MFAVIIQMQSVPAQASCSFYKAVEENTIFNNVFILQVTIILCGTLEE